MSEKEEDLMAQMAEQANPATESAAPKTPSTNDDSMVDQDAMAAEWEAMLESSDEESGNGEFVTTADNSNRILNQDEIDGLLGFNENFDNPSQRSGIQAILNSGMVSYERLPMLEIVFDRLVRLMSTSLRNFTQDNVEVSLEGIQSIRFGEYLNSIPLPAMLAVFKAEEWDNYGLMTIDSSLIYSIVDVLLGGRRGTAAMRIEGRPYTTIEMTLVERMVNVVFADLSAAFDPLSPVTFRYERLETNPRFAAISRLSNATIVAKLRIDMEDRGGRVELLIPYATLEPVRELLLQMFMGEKFGRDSIWEIHLAQELWQTQIDIHAILNQMDVSLADVLKWKEGHTLMLNSYSSSDVNLYCGDIPIFKGKMGKKDSNIAIKINKKLLSYEQKDK